MHIKSVPEWEMEAEEKEKSVVPKATQQRKQNKFNMIFFI